MAQDHPSGTWRPRAGWLGRFCRDRFTLAAATILLVASAVSGLVPSLYAVAGLVVVVAVALLGDADAPRAAGLSAIGGGGLARSAGPDVEAVIAALPDPAILLDRDGQVIAFNARARTVAPALTRNEPLSLSLRMPEVLEAVRTAAATAKPQRIEFSERVPIDRWYEANAVPLVPAGDAARPAFVQLTMRDLTPLRRSEEMRADFVANASHELRTPLASLSGFIDTLQGSARDDATARARFLDIMKAQAQRMARLIDDLLSLSRIELNAHIQPENPVDIVPVVRQVVDGLQMLARDRGVTVAVASPDVPLVVLGDRDELARVFENLVENALKYGASGKTVDISCTREARAEGGGEAVIAVRDHGPGIPPEHLPRLTERFYRVNVGQSRAEGGTGLGLALVKHILLRHRGRLTIDSRPGEGAQFTTRLPLHTGTPS